MDEGGLKPGESDAPGRTARSQLLASSVRALLGGLQRLPPQRALTGAAALGRGYARWGGPRVADARVNLRIAFPEWTEGQRRAVLERALANLCRSFVEFAQVGSLSAEALRDRVRIEGAETLEAARKASPSGGVVVLTAHFGSWELLASAMSAHGLPVAVAHRPRDNPVLDEIANGLRARAGTELFPRGSAARAALRGLRGGKLVAMTYDQNCRRNEGVFVPFFGRLACTRTGPPRIAMRTGCPVLPIFLHREGEGLRHVARIHPPVALAEANGDAGEAIRENAGRMARVIEAEIRAAPDHWAWIHRRWRTQPEGEPDPYRWGVL